MKKNLLLMCAVLLGGSAFSQINMTFRVDMSQVTVSTKGVHLAGNFNGWNPAATAMTDSDFNGVYEVTVSVEANTTTEYKFINGNQWGEEEPVGEACQVGGGNSNRYAEVGQNDATLTTVCFGSCNTCDQPKYDVTFRVDLTGLPVSANGVHVTGDFQGWNPGATTMTEVASTGIYEVTVQLEAGSYSYKFVNGDFWGDDESVPQACAVNDNRQVEVSGVSAVAYCFNECKESCTTTAIETAGTDRLQIEPNPFSDHAVVVLDTPGHYKWSIYSMNGSYVSGDLASGRFLHIDRGAMESGLYLLVVEPAGGAIISQKLVVE